MAKVVLCFHNHLIYYFNSIGKAVSSNTMPPFYEAFIKGMKDNGNELLVYNCALGYLWSDHIEIPDCPQKIKNEILSFNPDLVMLFNDSFYNIVDFVECPIVVYEVDSPMYYTHKKLIRKMPDRFKFCVAQSRSMDILKENYGVRKANIIHTPFFSELKRQDLELKNNICFIGSKFTPYIPSPINNFLSLNPSQDEISLFKQYLNEVKQNPYITYKELEQKFQTRSDKIEKTFHYIVEFMSDWSRIGTLSAVSDLGLVLYGSASWGTDLPYEPDLTLSFNKKIIYSMQDNQDVYNSSKIGININHHQAADGFSWRVCDIMASNACLVSEYKNDLVKLFPHINIPTFQNKYEAREQCKKLLNNENLRKDIVCQCNEAIEKNYRFSNVIDKLEYITGVSLRSCNANNTTSLILLSEEKKEKKTLISKLMIKRRFKCFAYLFVLLLAQIPVFDLAIHKKRRQKLLNKVHKYWR